MFTLLQESQRLLWPRKDGSHYKRIPLYCIRYLLNGRQRDRQDRNDFLPSKKLLKPINIREGKKKIFAHVVQISGVPKISINQTKWIDVIFFNARSSDWIKFHDSIWLCVFEAMAVNDNVASYWSRVPREYLPAARKWAFFEGVHRRGIDPPSRR